jgi:hypothetical protein
MELAATLDTRTTPLDVDEIYALSIADIFTNPFPYRANEILISNGFASLVMNEKKELSNETFADCVETSYRHLLNLLTYDSIQKTFNTEAFNNSPLKDLINNFYTLQDPSKVNDGSVKVRSVFNKITARVPHLVYSRGNYNEVEPGFINMIRFLSYLINEEITYPENTSDENYKKWIIDTFITLFKKINGKYKRVFT